MSSTVLQQVMEIFGFSQNAGLVALRRNNWNLDDTVTKLATEELFLQQVMDEAEKVNNIRWQMEKERGREEERARAGEEECFMNYVNLCPFAYTY